jgi:acetoacetate decarboxylase
MGFVKTNEEIMSSAWETLDFYNAEMLLVAWETKSEIYKRLIPPPLKPLEVPIVMAFVAHYPRTNFDVVYNESAMLLLVEYNGELGSYCLSMPVTNDMAMARGRERSGYPKKIADISFSRKGDRAGGWTERRGVRFMEFSAQLNGKFNDENPDNILNMLLDDQKERTSISYNFKHFPKLEGDGFDYNPRLIRGEVIFRPEEKIKGTVKITLTFSKYDPWAEVEVVKVLGALYTRGNNSMKKGSVVAEVDQIQFLPYSFLKWDMCGI